MKKDRSRLEALRSRALSALQQGQESFDQLPEAVRLDVSRLVEELRIYQAELEIQNHELIESQQNAERQLQRYTALFLNLPLPALVINDSGVVQEVNDVARRLFGLGSMQFLHHSVFRLLTRRDDPGLARLISRALVSASARVQSGRVAFSTIDAEEHWFEVHLHPLPEAGPSASSAQHFVTLLVDQTPHRQLMEKRQALKEADARFWRVFEETGQPAALIEGGRFVEINEAALEMLALDSVEQFLENQTGDGADTSADGLLDADERFRTALSEASHQGSAAVEWEGVRADGEPYVARGQLTRIEFGDKALVHASWHDVTEEVRVRRELEEMRAALERRGL